MDAYACTKWVLEEQKGCYDPSRVALHGTSAGAMMCLGVCHQMAQRNEGGIKLCVSDVAPCSDIWFDIKVDDPTLNPLELLQAKGHMDIYEMMHPNWQEAIK